MNGRKLHYSTKIQATITLIPTFAEDTLQYIKSRCRHNVSEEEKKQSVTILGLALWYSQDNVEIFGHSIPKHFTKRKSGALLGSQVSEL